MIFLVLLPASMCDLYCYRVPNVFVGIGFALCLYRNVCIYGAGGIGYALLKSLFPILLCLLFYKLRMIGAADIKLFSIISSYYSIVFCLRVMVVSVMIGAFFSIVKMIVYRNFFNRFRYFAEYIKAIVITKQPLKYYDRKQQGEDGIIPFTICISLAVVICMGG